VAIPVHITGAGIISAIGLDKQSTLKSLKEGYSGVEPVKYLHTEHHEFPVGEVNLSNEELSEMCAVNSALPRTALLGIVAIKEAVSEARLSAEDISSAALISGTTVGGMDLTEDAYATLSEKDEYEKCLSMHGCGATTRIIGDSVGKFSMMSTISTACSSATNAILEGVEMIRQGKVDIAVVGGSESLSRFHLNGFNSLMILDQNPCRPFDSSREGINLGEGAAFLVLESEASVRRRGVKSLGFVSGVFNACDAFHQTASSPEGEGAFLAMNGALSDAGLKPSDIDYINAHGTGTPNNDLCESAALRRIFGEDVPPMSSTKSYTGHATSSSGSIEAVICLLSIQGGIIPAGLRNETPDQNCVTQYTGKVEGHLLKHVLCNSFAFGGNDSSMVISSSDAFDSYTSCEAPKTRVYVKSTAAISCQKPLSGEYLDEPEPLSGKLVSSQDPIWTPFFTPMEGRRLSKILKRAVAVSKTALSNAGIDSPDAIITGTGLGCIENSEFFLRDICNNGESCLKPTYFMQSTHNTIGSTIGIRTKCHGYNTTISHQFISFDLSLMDAILKYGAGFKGNILLGAYDEITPTFENIFKKGSPLQDSKYPFSETAASFVLSDTVEGSICEVASQWIGYRPSKEEVTSEYKKMLSDSGLSAVDIVISSSEHAANLASLEADVIFKDIFADSMTSSALGFYDALNRISRGLCKSVLLVNEEPGKDVSLTLLKASK